MTDFILIPLRNINKEIIAYTKISSDYLQYDRITKEKYDEICRIKWHLSDGYARNGILGRLNRVVMGACKNDMVVDHINRDKLDNTSSNLRFATGSQNSQNKEKRGKTSQFRGVSFDKDNNKWRCAFIINNTKKTWSFDSEKHAAYWYDTVASKEGYMTNGIEKPSDFEEPKERNTKLLPIGVYKKGDKFFVQYKNKYIGIYETIEEASSVYEELLQKDKDLKNQNITIERNKNNQLVIFTSKNEEIIVSDENYMDLVKYKWHINNRGYVYGKVNNKLISMHKHVLNNNNPNLVVDHINGIKYDNRIENLRVVSKSTNNHNILKKQSTSSKYRGVCLEKKTGKFYACIYKNGKQHYLGYFENEEKAAEAYNKKALELYGTESKLNIICI